MHVNTDDYTRSINDGGGSMKRKIKISYNAPVVLSFVLTCLVVTLLGIVTKGWITEKLFMTYHSSLLHPLTYLRFFTHVLGHDGWSHFLGNASYLLLLGPMLEEKYGSKSIFQVVIVTAFVTGVINYIFFGNIALCGASGIVFAFIVLASFTNFLEGEIPLSFILVVGIFIGQQIYEGMMVQDSISNMAHIVGGMIGALLGYKFNKKTQFF